MKTRAHKSTTGLTAEQRELRAEVKGGAKAALRVLLAVGILWGGMRVLSGDSEEAREVAVVNSEW